MTRLSLGQWRLVGLAAAAVVFSVLAVLGVSVRNAVIYCSLGVLGAEGYSRYSEALSRPLSKRSVATTAAVGVAVVAIVAVVVAIRG